MKLYYSTIFFSLFLLLSCSQEEKQRPVLKQEKNQVWSIAEVDGEFQKDAITYLDSYEYDEDGNEIGHMLYDVDGTIMGKELSVFNDGFKQPVGTRYYTPEDSLLSYYTLKYDDDGNKISRNGYDASNDELLRIESYAYDKKGNMVRKDIKDAAGRIQSTFIFSYDAFGNKTSLTIKDANDNVRIAEDYRITKFDKDKQWLENWSWRNDAPVNFRTRELIYW